MSGQETDVETSEEDDLLHCYCMCDKTLSLCGVRLNGEGKYFEDVPGEDCVVCLDSECEECGCIDEDPCDCCILELERLKNEA